MDAALLSLTPDLLTGGQPSADQLRDIARAGYQSVINLALHNADYSLADEQALVESLGMRYLHLPVDWEAPMLDDYRSFANLLREQQGQRLFVHCAANKRVSIFIAQYRVCELGWDHAAAWADVLRVWVPDARWQGFYVEVLQAACAVPVAPELD